VIAGACSSPPEKERGQAEGAIAAARAASAEVYAPAELRAAEDALARYDAAVAQQDFRGALNAALQARDRAYEAASHASAAKAEARGRAEQLIQALQQLSQTARDRLSGARAPRLTGGTATRVRTRLTAAAAALQEAGTAITEGRYLEAVAGLEAAFEALQNELGGSTAPSGR